VHTDFRKLGRTLNVTRSGNPIHLIRLHGNHWLAF